MLHSLLQTEIPADVADSLKTVASNVINEIQSDPSVFFEELGKQAVSFGLKLLATLAIYIVGAWLIKKTKNLISRGFEKKGTEKTLASFVLSFVSIMLYVILVIITVSTLGINTTSLAAILAAGGMAIGMALSGTVQNFAGGIMLLVFKPFKAGDYITAQGYSGVVQEVNIASTKILTVDNRVVILPNGALSNGNIDNYSAMGLRRVDWTVSVEYGTDPDGCIEAIKDILSADSRILDAGTQGAADLFVALSSLNTNDISFTARAWVKSEDYWGVFFDGNKSIYSELRKRGFGFAYPHMDVRMIQ